MKALIAGIALLAAPSLAVAQEAAVEVAEAVIATGVMDRAPEGAATTFSSDVGQLVCFTRITGAEAGTQIEHVWYHEGQERARVPLSVGGSNWRTWSTKRIVPEWTGSWRVDIQTADGTVLRSVSFTVQ